VRLGLLGLDSSHADLIVSAITRGSLGPHTRLAALCSPRSPWAAPVDPARAETLRVAAGAQGARVFEGTPQHLVRELTGRVDAVVIADRDGRAHAEHAEPFLRAGVPVLVDKPFVLDMREAERLVEIADTRGVVLASYSPLRWHPRVREAANQCAQAPRGVIVTASGPCVAQSPYGGMPFYAVHAVEMALAVARGGVQEIHRVDGDGTVVVTVRTERDTAIVELAEPIKGEQTPFRIAVTVGDGHVEATVDLDANYLIPGMRIFRDAVSSGIAPVEGRSLVDVVRVLEVLRGTREPCTTGGHPLLRCDPARSHRS
jgi:Oxidoreductase family, NAD-binding Rossmann fold